MLDLMRKNKQKSERQYKAISLIQNIWLLVLIGAGVWYLSMAHQKLSIDYIVSPNRILYWAIFLLISGIILLIRYNLSLILTTVSMCLLITTVFISIGDTQSTIEDSSRMQTNIITDDRDTIKTNSNYLFVGRTNRYVFLYDRKSGENDYIPVEKIRKISFRRPK
jgi:hypothetical protein